MNILSVFDGCSGLQIALNNAGIKYNRYFASEVDKFAIKVTQTKFPDTIQLGDVCSITGEGLPHINLMAGGFPCTNFSIAGNRKGLEGETGKLFFELLRLKNLLKPDYFLFENVASMSRENQIFISEKLGVYPVRINSSKLSAQQRDRLYWTNFRTREMNLFGDLISDIPQPKDKGILLKDILQPPEEVDEKYYISEKALARIMKDVNSHDNKIVEKSPALTIGGNGAGNNSDTLYFKQVKQITDNAVQGSRIYDTDGISPALLSGMSSGTHAIAIKGDILTRDNPERQNGFQENKMFALRAAVQHGVESTDRYRRLTVKEVCRLQTMPDDYFFHEGKQIVSDNQIYKMTGNGFTIAVIEHILQYLPK